MKIISQQQDKMVLQERLLWVRVIGVVFALLGLDRLTSILPFIDTSALPVWFGAIFLVSGIIVLIFVESTTITLDKAIGRMVILKKSLVRKREEVRPLAGIQKVEMVERLERSHDKRGSSLKSYFDIELVHADGSKFPLKATTTMNGFGASAYRGRRKRLAENIATFLGVPFVEITPPPPPTATEILSTMADTICGEIRRAQGDRFRQEMKEELKEEIRKEMEREKKD